jgi:hypothetical protein
MCVYLKFFGVDVWVLEATSPKSIYSCSACHSRGMVDESVQRHLKSEKHQSSVVAFQASRAAAIANRSDAEGSRGTHIPASDTREPEVLSSREVPTPPEVTSWVAWTPLRNQPADTDNGENDEDWMSARSMTSDDYSSDAGGDTESDSHLSEYNSNNEADDEEWAIPGEFREQPGDLPEDETEKHGRRCRVNNPWWPFRSKEVRSFAPTQMTSKSV